MTIPIIPGGGGDIDQAIAQLALGMDQSKCHHCGCMRSAIEALNTPDALQKLSPPNRDFVQNALGKLLDKRYECLGCDHCYPGVASHNLRAVLGDMNVCQEQIEPSGNTWPPIAGEYHVLDPDSPVAATTLSDHDLAHELARLAPRGLAITGPCETQNIGVEKVVLNIISNPAIRFLVLAGPDSKGHASGATLLALHRGGLDADLRVPGAPDKHTRLVNLGAEGAEAFMAQVEVIDLIGQGDAAAVAKVIEGLNAPPALQRMKSHGPQKIAATGNGIKLRLDPVGYFIVIPSAEKGLITVEHYSNDHRLMHVVEGSDIQSIYSAVISGGMIGRLDHAAYLGVELARAEMCMRQGTRYVQDKAPGKS